MSRIVIYHGGCPDGFTAAWVYWRMFRSNDTVFGDTEYFAATIGEPPPDVAGRDVIIVDYSYPRDVLVKMHGDARTLKLLDHHKSAMDRLSDLTFCTFDMNRSGAMMAHDSLVTPIGSRPWVVDYVQDYDLWRFDLPKSKEVNAWIKSQPRTFEAWDELNRQGVERAKILGAAVLVFQEQYMRSICEESSGRSFHGYSVPVVNCGYPMISEVVGKLAESAPFAVGWYVGGDGLYHYSLRSRGEDGMDVCEIAKRFGGGGHKNAAGFKTVRPVV